MFLVFIFPLLVMYFSLLRSVLHLPLQNAVRQPDKNVIDNQRPALAFKTRGSTRISHAVLVRVTAIALPHGLCTEVVAADAVSCHGFAFKWKYDVPIDSKVVLELHDGSQTGQPVFARGVVKWRERPSQPDQNDFFHTAIQFERPENIWQVDSPPVDWLPFSKPTYLVPPQARETAAASRYAA